MSAITHVDAVSAAPHVLRLRIDFVCGKCHRPSTAPRSDIMAISNEDMRLACYCWDCGTWNLTDLVQT